RRPDCGGILSWKSNLLEPTTLPAHLGDRSVDVAYLPPQNRVGRRPEVAALGDANHDSVRVEHESEPVVLDEVEAQGVLIKRPRTRGVGRRNERKDLTCC